MAAETPCPPTTVVRGGRLGVKLLHAASSAYWPSLFATLLVAASAQAAKPEVISCELLRSLMKSADGRFKDLQRHPVIDTNVYEADSHFAGKCYVFHLPRRDSYDCEWSESSSNVEALYEAFASWTPRCMKVLEKGTTTNERVLKEVEYVVSESADNSWIGVVVSERRNAKGMLVVTLKIVRKY